MSERETVGKISSDLLQKEYQASDPIEQMQENLNDWEANVSECLEKYKKEFLHDFYLVVISKTEPLMPNVIRHYYTARISCPTPDNDQVVYKYHRAMDMLEFLWVIPDPKTCDFLIQNRLLVPESERDLLNFVLEFTDGTLLQKSKQLNNETPTTGQLLLHKGAPC